MHVIFIARVASRAHVFFRVHNLTIYTDGLVCACHSKKSALPSKMSAVSHRFFKQFHKERPTTKQQLYLFMGGKQIPEIGDLYIQYVLEHATFLGDFPEVFGRYKTLYSVQRVFVSLFELRDACVPFFHCMRECIEMLPGVVSSHSELDGMQFVYKNVCTTVSRVSFIEDGLNFTCKFTLENSKKRLRNDTSSHEGEDSGREDSAKRQKR